MKESTTLNGNLKKQSEELTQQNSFITKIKESIFGVYYILLKEEQQSFFALILFSLIEFLQILSFSFHPVVT